jgi:hypothetical protein
MENPQANMHIKAAFIGVVAVLLAIFVGSLVGTADYRTLLLGVVVIVGSYVWFFTGRFFWVLTIASSFLGGTFPILRGQFTPFQILMVMGVIKFIVEDVIFRRTRLKLPSRFDILMIVGFMGVITVHGIHDRFGMRFLGSAVWGGRHYVNVFVGLAAFFVIQSIPMKRALWAKFPYVVLAVVSFDLLVAIVTTVFPGSIYIIYPFYSAVSMSNLLEMIGGTADITGRIGAFGNFGFIMIAIVFATVSLRSLLHPSNFGRIIAMIAGAVGVLLSGFRSAVLNTCLLVITTGIRDLKAGIIFLIPLVAIVFFTLSVVNSEIIALPKQMQRGLAFLPGNWDYEMASDATASNNFRIQVWTLWAREYFPKQPILGRGFGFKSEWTKKSVYYGNATDYRQMVETGNIHNGFLASLDTFGILGTVFFVLWNVRLLIAAFRVRFDHCGGDYFALQFLALYLAVWILSYWIGAQTVGTFLPQQFALAGLFLRLRKDLIAPEEKRRRRPAATPRPFREELVRA